MLEQSPFTTPPLIQHQGYNGMIDYGDQILLGTAQKIPELEADTNNFLQELVSITGSLSEKYEPLSLEQYVAEVNRLRETTSSSPSDITPAMIKTDSLDPELAEIGWRRLNFPWFTVYSPKRYRKGLDLIIHKYPNDCRLRSLRPILLFDI